MTTPDVPYRFEVELVVPGTPEQVWDAIASADGIAAWMMPTELEPRVGGSVAFHMGPEGVSRGRVTAFEPARRVAYEEDWATLVGHGGADVTPLATEFLVEARSGGTCVVRVVTSAFGTGADWENEFWGDMERGWAPMLDNLRLYLTYFPGRRVTSVSAGTSFSVAPEAAIAALRDALHVSGAGDSVSGGGFLGTVERSIDYHFLIRVEQPAPGLISIYAFGTEQGAAVRLQGYLFPDGSDFDADSRRGEWQAWLDGIAESTQSEMSERT